MPSACGGSEESESKRASWGSWPSFNSGQQCLILKFFFINSVFECIFFLKKLRNSSCTEVFSRHILWFEVPIF